MHTAHKAAAWGKEFFELFRGTAVNAWHTTPPEHYLGYMLDGRVPVVLIPGIMNRWGYMKSLGDKISLLGHPVHLVPELGNNISSIPESAKMLDRVVSVLVPHHQKLHHIKKGAEAVRRFIEQKDIKGVVLVAHSKGGLIGKYLLMHYNHDHRVLGLVAMAAPFSGSAIAKLFPHHAFKELHHDSDILQDLKRAGHVNERIISIYPEYDTHVWAEKKSFLDGALENIELPLHGHSIVTSRLAQTAVIAGVEKLTRMPV